jgi:hypothetical protein
MRTSRDCSREESENATVEREIEKQRREREREREKKIECFTENRSVKQSSEK